MRTAFTAYTALALLATAHSATLVVTDDNGNAQWAMVPERLYRP